MRTNTLLPLFLVLPVLQDAPGTARPWEHESSDLAPSARIVFGRLENGLRYAWMRNTEPKERCYVRLHVDVGALAEEDDQDGMAHFLEHMAFNGSEHFPAGTLVEWFQEHGLAFGADLNAVTMHSQTVYRLDLPRSDEEMLDEGLTVLRDWADGLLLQGEEVDREKGVIDAEQASGDSAGRRVRNQLIATQYAGTLYAERDVIGERAVRAGFDADGVRAFYERWYRPELMTVLVVGDLGELDPAPLIAKHFADLAPPGTPVPSEPDAGEPALEERWFSIHEPEIPTVSVHVERLVRWEDEPDTKATRTDELDLGAARRMLNQRFDELVKKEGTPFLGAHVSGAGGLEVYDGESFSVTSRPERWQEALAAADDELRRALQFGFQQPELDEVRADWLRSLDEAVQRERTRHSGSFVQELVAAAEERHVPTDAETERALLRPVIEALTVEACHEAFAAAWKRGVLNVYTVGSLDLGEDAADVLRETYERLGEREVEKGAELAVGAFAYSTPADAAGKVVKKEHVEDLDVWLLELENGVRVNLKKTDFQDRQILVHARVAEGILSLPSEDFATAWVGAQVFDLGGLGKHDVDELRRLTAGKRVGLGFGLGNEAFDFAGSTTEEDLLLELELLRATLVDPGWRDDGLRLVRDRLPLMFEQLTHSPVGPLRFDFLPALFHGDARFAELPARGDIEAVTMDSIRSWLAPLLATGPVEVTLIGDLDLEEAEAAVTRTLGTLPPRRALEPHDDRREVEPPKPGIRMTRAIDTEDERSFVFVALPIPDGRDAELRRGLKFLSAVVQDRLRIRAREEKAVAYSPGANANPSEVYPGVGLLLVSASLPPEHAETFLEEALAILRDVREGGVTPEEVRRLTEPVLSQIREAERTNGYWTSVLMEAQRDPTSLDDARTVEAYYRGLDPEWLSALAKEHLDPEKASVLVVMPEEEAAPEDEG